MRRITSHPYLWPAIAILLLVVAAAFNPAFAIGAPIIIGAVLTEGRRPGEFLLSEAPGRLSRDTVTLTVPGDTTLEDGTVLGQVTVGGKYVPFDETASDGREEPAGILHGNVINDDEAPADKTVVVVNCNAEVREAGLVWYDGADDAAGLAGLRSLFIKARE